MTLTINGELKTMEHDPLSLTALLSLLGFGDRPVLVEHNGAALLPRTSRTCICKTAIDWRSFRSSPEGEDRHVEGFARIPLVSPRA